MPTIQAFTLGTWNLQKGPALQNLAKQNVFAAAAISARFQMLGFLHNACDIVFAQEPPEDIRQETQQVNFDAIEAQSEVWLSYNQQADNQVHKCANRPAFWSRWTLRPLISPSDCPVNGNEDAFRLSAMGWGFTSLGEAIFISLHATSGYNAKRNTTDFLRWLAGWVASEHPGVRFVVIGADFNHTCDPQAQFGGVTASFRQPTQMTQQSGSILDGFCCLAMDPAVTVKWRNAQRVLTGELNGPVGTRMVQVNPNVLQFANQRGYIADLPAGLLPGTNGILHSPLSVRMSDHCAVVATLELTVP